MNITVVPPAISHQKSTSCLRIPARITPANTNFAMSTKNLFACANSSCRSFLVRFFAMFFCFLHAKIQYFVETSKFFAFFSYGSPKKWVMMRTASLE